MIIEDIRLAEHMVLFLVPEGVVVKFTSFHNIIIHSKAFVRDTENNARKIYTYYK
jgi:hypothetical protein